MLNFGKLGIFRRNYSFLSKQVNVCIANSLSLRRFSAKAKNRFDKDGFPISTAADIYPEDDLIFDIKEPETFKGMLIVCPTPIGNVNDMTLRQYEAIKTGDILACEDSRVTSKLIDHINRKKMKELFYMEFGVHFEDFVNKGGLDMTDEKIEEVFLKNQNAQSKPKPSSSNDESIKEPKDTANLYTFLELKEDVNKRKNIESRLKDIDSKMRAKYINTAKQTQDLSEVSKEEEIKKLEKKLFTNFKSKEHTLDFVENKEDFDLKRSILEEENLTEEIETIADDYLKNRSLSFKLKSKAKFIMGVNRNLYKEYEEIKEKNEEEQEGKDSKKSGSQFDYLDLESGLEDNAFSSFKNVIKNEKSKKGRGLLYPYRKETEELATPRLIKAMKLGLKVILLCDAGTPGISDPGYRLVNSCVKNGITVESLPGPCAAITALSASGMPTDNFLFLGYLSRVTKDKNFTLNKLKNNGVTGIIYESPARVLKTLESLESIFTGKHKAYIANELTKKFETHHYGTITELIEKVNNLNLSEHTFLKGEVTIVVAPFKKDETEYDRELEKSDHSIPINILETARKLNDEIDMSLKDLKELLIKLFDIPRHRADKIASIIKSSSNKRI